MTEHWEVCGWRKVIRKKANIWKKGDKVLWNTGSFANVHIPEQSRWIDRWTVADIANGACKNHRTYNSFEEALEAE